VSSIDQDTEDLCRVGPGTVMGDLMRQYWIPVAMSSEVEADGAPMRLMILGEKLIAFRDSSGRVGLMDHRCPHRCASLFLGRNEEDGLRCIYHGWKFDVEGKCVDMPSVPAHQDFKDKVHAKAYKTFERGGLIWGYMGASAEAPPLPMVEANMLPEGEGNIAFVQRECNYLQALEGDIDTSHFSFLHAGSVEVDDLQDDDFMRFSVADRAPEFFVSDAPWGTTYCAYRAATEGRTYWRFANFLFPFWAQTPQGEFPDHITARAWVPMDDTHTMSVSMTWKKMKPGIRPMKDGSTIPGVAQMEYLPNTTDWYGRWRTARNQSNDYMIDREAQRDNRIYSGITIVHIQDQAVTETMGGITDHAFEHLAPGDQMIARTRRRLLRAARALRESGVVPEDVANPSLHLGARSGEFLTKGQPEWQEAYMENFKAAVRPVPGLRAAE